jgi:transposase
MTKEEQMRLVRFRSKLMQMAAASSRGVSRAWRHFGISRKTFYKWKKRYDEHGDAGLCDQARTPRNMSNATPSEVVSKILYLRESYHFGPRKIADYLKRFHQVSIAGYYNYHRPHSALRGQYERLLAKTSARHVIARPLTR